MNRQSPLAANPLKPGHWIPGQRLIYMSTGVAERISSEELKELTRDDALAI